MNNLWLDIRYAMRQLRKTPGFTLTAVLTLAFGIGATTAIFSIVEGVLLRPLPFADPDRLVIFGDIPEGVPGGDGVPGLTAPATRIYPRDMHVFEGLGGYQHSGYELSGLGEPAQISASRLAASVFPVLGVSPLMGRTFTRQEDEGSAQVAVISYPMWRIRFHGEAHILGQKILLDRRPYEIIGVMPQGFEFPLNPGQLNRSELWVPLSLSAGELGNQGSWNYEMVGRLKPGVTFAQVLQDARPAVEEIMHNFPPGMASLRIHPLVRGLNDSTVARARPLVGTMFIAVAVVLFIACANLAGLLLVRVIRRRREISVRLALGANSGAVVRQALMEALSLSVGGGVLGLALAAVALRLGVSLLPETLPRVSFISLDWKVAGFAMILAVATGFLCGSIPALTASRTTVNDALKEGGRTGSSGAGSARLRSALVVAELAVALVLLCGAGLLLRSFEKMRSVDLGFRTDHTLTAFYGLPRQQYSTQTSVDAFNTQLLSKLEQLPGVEAAGITSLLPIGGGDSNTAFVPEGYVPPKGAGLNLAWPPQVIGDYFHAAGISLLRGREFNNGDDRVGAPLVAIVNRTLAERYWHGQDPIGKRLKVGVPESPTPWMTVVGEIVDIKQTSPDGVTLNQFYTPASQFKAAIGQFAPPDMIVGDYGSIALRSQLLPNQMADSLRAVVRSIDPLLPLTQIESMDRVVEEGQAPRRFNTVLISSFAGAAVLLAVLGIYSVIAYTSALRTQEMAIRLALGSQRVSVMRLVLGSGVRLGLAGCGIGALGAILATRLLRSMLFHVDPLDPAALATAVVTIFLLALAASAVPAHRAASIQPMQALRDE